MRHRNVWRDGTEAYALVICIDKLVLMSMLTRNMLTRPRYVLVAEALENHIVGMSVNSLLSTEEQLSRDFQVSRVTVRRALSLIERKGLISRERGRGTIVNRPKITRQLLPVCPIEQDLLNQGRKLETEVSEWKTDVSPPNSIAARLALRPGKTVCFLSLIRKIDGRPLCHDQRFLPSSVAKKFDPALLASRPIHYILQDLRKLAIGSAECELELTAASFEVARKLGLLAGGLVLVNTFTNFFENGQPAEAGVMSYRIDLVKIKFSATGSSMLLTWPPDEKSAVASAHHGASHHA